MLDWLIGGQTEAHIVDALKELFPAADPTKVAAEVQRLLIEEANPRTEALVGWLTLAYRDLYRRTREIGDFDGARKMLNELRRLYKL